MIELAPKALVSFDSVNRSEEKESIPVLHFWATLFCAMIAKLDDLGIKRNKIIEYIHELTTDF